MTFAVDVGRATFWGQPNERARYAVGDSVEGNARNLLVRNAIPFFSANDPRVPARYIIAANGRDTTKAQDGFTFSRTTTLYGRSLTSVRCVNGLDARLIEAEARAQGERHRGDDGDPQRAACDAAEARQRHADAALPALAAPATRGAAVDLLFREKAFWTFSRGQRLGDLRRLIRQYGRTQDQVFPVGEHYRGGNYGGDVNLPVPQAEENNPELNNRAACIDRNA